MAQAELDACAWVSDYNERRPHQGIGMSTPAERFRGNVATVDLPEPSAGAARDSDDWVSRRVAANGVISVAHQQFSVGKHRAGVIVDVHLDGQLLQVWHRDELLKTIVRTDHKEVRKKRAARAR